MTTLALSYLVLPALIASNPVAQTQGLSTADKAQVMANLAKEIEESYVEIETSKKMAAAIREWAKSTECTGLSDPAEFATKVNEMLKKHVTDAHLRFRYSPNKLPVRQAPREPSPSEEERYAREVRFVNANFEKVERLRGNVGYIKFNGFADPSDMARPLEGAMKFLANCDAFIIDLRNNGGGSPAGVQLFCSYFFSPTPVHLNSIAFRRGDKLETREYWTLKDLPGPRFPTQPVYVLTSKRTGSGAEECAYNFQTQKRGTIVGEPTWGGANPGGMVRLSDHFGCFIPTGKAINPITKTNWEAVGVKPDIAMNPADSLVPTQLLALQSMIDKEKDPDMKKDLQGIYDSVKSGTP